MSDKAKIDLTSLQPEFFANEPTWSEFMEGLADVIQEQIREPIGEIEDIRHIVETTDPEIIARTIKQLGFDIPADLIRHNAQRLAKSVYMLSLIHEKSGTEDFVKGVRFVLGRDIEVSHTYTQDYENFYRKPAGPMIKEGGDWYKTTHVDLGMELIPSDVNMILPVGKNLSDRLMDAYFEFAPINHVVREFYFMVKSQISLGVAGKVIFYPIDFITIGLGGEVLRNVQVKLPDSVVSGSSFPVHTDALLYSGDCYDLLTPRYGYSNSPSMTAASAFSVLTEELDTTNNATVAFSRGKYVFFAFPAALGKALFIEKDSKLEGGWEGLEDNGPKLTVINIAGKDQDWYVYRTDAKLVDETTFEIQFDNPGIQNSCDVKFEHSSPSAEPAPEEPDDDNDVTVPCVPNMTPQYGSFNYGLNTDAEIEFLPNSFPDNNDRRFTVDVPSGKYGYFAYPVDLGYARFVEASSGLEGGWEGATWADGEVGDSKEPIKVVRNICGTAVEWFIYRTDFSGIGSQTFDVSFGHPGLVLPVEGDEDEEEETCVSGYPTFTLGPIDVDIDTALEDYGFVLGSTENTSLVGELDEYEYGYFAYPVELGVATITELSTGDTELWNGASWPVDGSVGTNTGPIIIQRQISGRLYDWYLHRTNTHTMPETGFSVEFPEAGRCVDTLIAFPPTEGDPTAPVDDSVASLPCHLNALPRFGSLTSMKGSTPAVLPNELPSTDNQTFSINVENGKYGYFSYPASLGQATFIEVNSNLVGGWGGATWEEDGSIGTSFGPALIEHTVGSLTSKWYVYRTDWPSLGNQEFRVSFENAGLTVGYTMDSCDTGSAPEFDHGSMSAPTRMSTKSVPYVASVSCTVNGYPRFGTGNNLWKASDILDLSPVASTSHQDLTIDVDTDKYGWFAYPAAMGFARFVSKATGIEGGWDGATWPEGSIEFSTGPVLVNVNVGGVPSPWYLYRTDLPSIGNSTFQIFFDAPGLSIGDSVPCTVKGVPAPLAAWSGYTTTSTMPVYGSADTPVENNADVNTFLTSSVSSLASPSFSLNVPAGHYGYFAYPAYLGYATIQNPSNTVKWEGDSSPLPMYLYRRVDGKLQTWYIYRTQLPGVGSHTFSVKFDSAPPSTAGRRLVRVPSPVMTTDRPDIVSFTASGVAVFAPVYRDTTVNITSTFGGMSNTKTVIVKGAGAVLESILLNAPTSVSGGNSFKVTVEGYFDDRTTKALNDVTIKVLSPYVTGIKGYEVFTGNPEEDKVVYVEASYVTADSYHLKSVRPVIIKAVSTNIKVDSIHIIGPPELSENTSHTYRAHVFYSDGSQEDVLALWESSSPGLYVDQGGRASAGIPDADYLAELKATYQHQGQKHIAVKVVEIKRDYITPKTLTIQGPSSVVELSNHRFVAIIEWSNGVTTQVDPVWMSDRFSISESGVFTTGSVSTSISVELTARALDITVSKVVSVYTTPINIESINIVGQENVRQGIAANYRAFARYSDGREIEVSPVWSLNGSYPGVTMTPAGELTFTSGNAGIVEIRAVFDSGAKRHVQTKPIVLIPDVNLITGLRILGDSEVLENRRVTFEARAWYEDGSDELVEPVWTVRSPDPLNNPEAEADIVSPGIMQGRSVEEDTLVIVVARYFREVAEFPVVVKRHDRPGPSVPISSRISGPSVIPVSRMGSYVFMIEFDNGCNQELAVSNDWSIDVSPDVAIIDRNGFLRSMNNQTTVVNITADWACDGHTATDTMQVTLLAEASPLQTLIILGESSVPANSFESYNTELFYVGDIVSPGTGTVLPNESIEWSVQTIIPNVSIEDDGVLYIGNVPTGTSITIKARYEDGLHSVEATKLINITAGSAAPTPPPPPSAPSYAPMYGVGPEGLSDFASLGTYLNDTMSTSSSGNSFTTETTGSNYIYYAHPAALGTATFTEPSLGLSGGMDGATWPAGGIGSTYGPLTVTRTIGGVDEDWYLYRSDFPGIGEITFRVDYS